MCTPPKALESSTRNLTSAMQASVTTEVTECVESACKPATILLNGTNIDTVDWKDAQWIMTTAVIIFTMQTGFGLLESGSVSAKNEVNIMMKNALDVIFGGITYWAFGFGISFGRSPGSNGFIGFGCFFVDAGEQDMGYVFSIFIFQLSFATTATTIVSGAMAERTKLSAYLIFSMLSTLIYCVPAHWLWSDMGFLHVMGAIDVAGCGPVHLVGGVTGLVATIILKPRMGCFKDGKDGPPMSSPLKSILGMFMLWWGWLRFNAGSVFGVSSRSQWKLAVRASVNTINASMGGGITSILLSLLFFYAFKKTKFDIATIINGVLGSLVSVTAICTYCRPWEAIVIGSLAAIFASITQIIVAKLKIDDPVGVVPVHVTCAVWGLLAVGLFVEHTEASLNSGTAMKPELMGVFKNGGWGLLGVQSLTCLLIIVWTAVTSFIMLQVLDRIIGIRLSPEHELIGADFVEHGVALPIGSDLNSKSVIRTVTEGSLEGVDRDFQDKLQHVFLDLASSCHRNELKIQFRKDEATNTLTLEMKLPGAESMDSGIDTPL